MVNNGAIWCGGWDIIENIIHIKNLWKFCILYASLVGVFCIFIALSNLEIRFAFALLAYMGHGTTINSSTLSGGLGRFSNI